MDKLKIGQIIIMTEEIGVGCQKVYKNTIGTVINKLDSSHVVLSFTRDGDTIRNANVCRYRLPVDAEEEKKCETLYQNVHDWKRASID